ncbi:MAG: NAD-dependent deacylase [Deltaproteobacteria bacterium]|nr:NAD-dependent deacylase [Deltaproteobacteria bacterium]MBW1930236.1 NAD-dependent deacylase [Deltaproteobacteria bacterium]MBW2024299.1 NAD-dependent deacylase [Deltaproteobacteria bacterium]MBW2125324.1 NAD-dependent deacylase [Deltaproteobacteria bacterium]RLB24132.1 MAG: RNA polymerase subunit sigma [Deltaproteobacteria bacterium]
MQELISQAAEIILRSKLTLALTGAGISVESGIPDFRSADGLWSKYDPAEYATIEAFQADPEKVWQMLRDMEEVVASAKPNKAHIGLGELEKMGYLHYIITQNIDNLHQEGGSKNVIEYHGNSSTLSCIWCGKRYKTEEKRDEFPPKCECKKILKPDVVFFGEPIPAEALNRSFQLASSAEALLVIGTSAVVSPANTIPTIAKQNHAKIIEINKERTHLTDSITDIFLQGGAGAIVESLVEEVKRQGGGNHLM